MDEEIIELSGDVVDFAEDEEVGDGQGQMDSDERERLLARLRDALLASEPALERSMVTGESIEELEASFAAAKATLGQLREAVRREQAGVVPNGSVGRSGRPVRSAFEKIREGLE